MMRRTLLAATLSVFAMTALALEPAQPTMPADAHTDMLTRDLHAIGRVTALADNLERERQVLLAILDSDIRDVRMPREDGTYQWASLQREEGGRFKDEKTIEHVYTEKELRKVTVSGPNGYR